MPRIYRRQFLAYALGLLTATAGFAVGAAWAGHAATGGSVGRTIRIYVGDARVTCKEAGGREFDVSSADGERVVRAA